MISQDCSKLSSGFLVNVRLLRCFGGSQGQSFSGDDPREAMVFGFVMICVPFANQTLELRILCKLVHFGKSFEIWWLSIAMFDYKGHPESVDYTILWIKFIKHKTVWHGTLCPRIWSSWNIRTPQTHVEYPEKEVVGMSSWEVVGILNFKMVRRIRSPPPHHNVLQDRSKS